MTIQFKSPQSAQIEPIVAALSGLRKRSQEGRYGVGVLPQLMSRKEVAAIVDGLIAAIYPRHFGPAELSREATDAFVASALSTSLASLSEQVRRELNLFADHGAGAATEPRAHEITNSFARTIPKVRALLDTDIRAAYAGDPAAKSFDEIVFCYPGVSAIIRHRLAHELYLRGAPMLARIIAEIAHSQTGIDIHPGADIGEGFFIDHGTGVVVGETARIGRNVRPYQAVTLGAKRFKIDETGALEKGKPRHPMIEDDVVIYAGATVLERITIGRGSSIGGNVWLTHSVPPGSNITQAKAHVESFDSGGGI